MIIRTRGGDRELRAAPFDSSGIPAPWEGAWWPSSGERVTADRALAVPAVLNAIRLIAETTGRLPLRVYSGFQSSKRTREDTWQWDLLHRRPNPERSAFDFWQDVATCIESRGNAYAYKAKSRRRVEALFLISPDLVAVDRSRQTGELIYKVHRGGEVMELTSAEILHFRGIALNGGDVGITPIRSEAIGSALARYRHEGSVYKNHASIPYALRFKERMSAQQAAEALAIWKRTHSGGGDSGNPGVLSNDAAIEKLGLTMEDAQFIESHEFSVRDVARIFNVPASLLNGADTQPTEEESRRFLNFGLAGRLDRISAALGIDEDLFPARSGLYPEFLVEEFIAADALTQAQIRHLKIQDGSLLIDEARADDGRAPLPDGIGQIPQITPVGGAPNPAAVAANS